ncbi:hypothetical protein AAZX31_10G139500 [Glycine max]|uniref:DUF4378 domain-containing protein n=2 Tax=Glycine subgen. Soja TaxID=1462606 RepID=K7LJH3_SOYBN|nr:uncharacterized protein LOC102665160 isoform X2 [Glycine max]XP_028182739.1 uncharacterized protein LOC114369692 isoform X2 [Glycine soja]KAH1138291.1 hypothetical protein GYH30_028031 [Glycine max]KAH1138292.1 hypothetical protein GYH30_028031 [Glycine max]KRH33836.1 hypothetical protein GLYMA_10G148200v4 [Glycine max]RZB87312.1 hypothetical protein D0Y65_027108 [Glycine soja]|eukprot:XP_006589122.1 uncharacterized protein LOC102665160 isoform X2 [Glycine max]
MEIQKKGFKGSFLSFFDWNGKSQKKLLCDRPILPDVSKQGKENMDSMPKSQENRIKMDDNGVNPSNNASCGFDCAISINSDEGYGTKAPGLVARLMGLDSLPVLTVSELSSSSTSLYGSNSLGSSHSHDEDVLHSMVDYGCPVDPINMRLKPEKSSWGAMQSRALKVGNPSMKRFQTEMLPPKSAKPIPVSHNKLLSPIKSPAFMQPKHAAHIMEAATKIIEASPQPCRRNKMSSYGPSSVSLRILDLKEKLEAAQYESKFMDTHTANPLNGKPSERRNNLYKSTLSFKGSRHSVKNSSCQLASKGKSASLAMPSKTNAQSRDELTLNGNRRYMRQKEHNNIKSNQLPRSQKKQIADRGRVMQQRACTSQNRNVLGKNNQKQNSVTNKGSSASKMDSNKPTQTWSSESSTGAKKTKKKVSVNANIEPKRFGTRITDTIKEFPVSKRKGISQKKNYSSCDIHNKPRGSDSAANTYENMPIKCNITTDGSIDQDAFSMKGSNGVISFTFTSPLRRNLPELQSSSEQAMGTRNKIDVNSCSSNDKFYPQKSSFSPPRLHVIDGDALSVLLEKKLQELTSRINPPQCSLTTEGSSTGLRSSLEDKFRSVLSTTVREQDISFYNQLDSVHDNCSSSDIVVLSMNQQLQTSESMEEPSCRSNSESKNGSYLDSAYEWSEQSSSIVMGDNMASEQSSVMSNSAEFTRSARNMELEYVKDIFSNAELMTEEFVVGETDKIIMPNLFDKLENKGLGAENYEEYSKIERRAIFDTVSECLELRCRQIFVGSCKAWPKWLASVQRKNCLAEEFYKEILSFRSMEEEVEVDELVNKDMSTGWCKWLDFEIEAFEKGSELEFDILTCLINELVSDLLHV